MFKFNSIKKFTRTLIIAEVSAIIAVLKKILNHIVQAKENGADLVKIQTYEPQDMIVNKNFKIKSGLWKGKIYGNFIGSLVPFMRNFRSC